MNFKQTNCGKDEPLVVHVTVTNDFGKGVILGASVVAIVILA